MPSPAAIAFVARREKLGTQHVDMPQILVDGKPLRVFWTPMTVSEADRLSEYRGRPEGDVYVLIEKARDAEGKPLFTLEDKQLLMLDSLWHDVSMLAVLMAAMPTLGSVQKK